MNAAPIISTNILAEKQAEKHGEGECCGHDHFTTIHPQTDWRDQISHAEKIGLGSGEYELITVN